MQVAYLRMRIQGFGWPARILKAQLEPQKVGCSITEWYNGLVVFNMPGFRKGLDRAVEMYRGQNVRARNRAT